MVVSPFIAFSSMSLSKLHVTTRDECSVVGDYAYAYTFSYLKLSTYGLK